MTTALRSALALCTTIIAAITLTACDGDTTTSPTSTSTTTTTVAEATIAETFESTVPVGGAKFYPFSVVENGTVNISLTGAGGQLVPSTVMLGVALGQPAGTECSVTTTVNVSSSTATPHITGTYAPGVYCVRVSDIGNLFAPATIAVAIAHS